ncbi:MAG: thermonuclease family protein [Bacteroidota bacterium]
MYHYKAFIKHVYDGNTVKALVDLGFFRYEEMTLELYGVHASGFEKDEYARRKEAKDVLQDLLLYKEVEIYSYREKEGKFGNYMATVILDGLDVNQWLVENELAQQHSA